MDIQYSVLETFDGSEAQHERDAAEDILFNLSEGY